MNVGFLGLGRMGSRMVEHLLAEKQSVVVYNRSIGPTQWLSKKGAIPTFSLEEFVTAQPKPRTIWLMINAAAVDMVLAQLLPLLSKGDIVLDGGNSFYKDSQKHFNFLKKKGIHFMDVGTSGGLTGARNGACLMIGGERLIYQKCIPLFRSLAVPQGYAYLGKPGAGHFAKMVHNGIEYGMMASLAEGFEALETQRKDFGFELADVASLYNRGTIIQSQLTHWTADLLQKNTSLSGISGSVPEGETEAVLHAYSKEHNLPVLKTAIQDRINSRKHPSFRAKIIAALRNIFGGHKVNR